MMSTASVASQVAAETGAGQDDASDIIEHMRDHACLQEWAEGKKPKDTIFMA